MDFEALEYFIHKKMRMTHIYQPSMIKTLLESDGTATTEQIAMGFLNYDMAYLKYYKNIVKRWPHKTLKKHDIINYEKDVYTLNLDAPLTDQQRRKLIELCDLRWQEFVDKDPWIRKFRELDTRVIKGSTRYDVLAKSKGVCVACGVESTKMRFHVDHIVPHSSGGKTELENLQALCWQCNQEKNNRDETNFLNWHLRMKYRNKKCSLCNPKKPSAENRLACATSSMQGGLVSSCMVMPRRHVGVFSDLIPAEKNLCIDLLESMQLAIRQNDDSVEGFSVGFDSWNKDNDPLRHCRIVITPTR